jgi:hypothetical protein
MSTPTRTYKIRYITKNVSFDSHELYLELPDNHTVEMEDLKHYVEDKVTPKHWNVLDHNVYDSEWTNDKLVQNPTINKIEKEVTDG